MQWTGDADIDVMVKEPGGTICSLRNQRTTGGGMLVGDLSSPDGKESIEGHMAVYSCPKAISGEYQVLVRRVFGNVPTGHVKVIVDQHMFTPQAKQTVWDKIPVKDGESVVKFTLADGRRKESAHEAQIVNAAVAAVGHPAAAGDPRAAACRAERSAAGAGAGGFAAEYGHGLGRLGTGATAGQPAGVLAQQRPRSSGLPARDYHPADWNEHGRYGRRFGRPPLCPHHLCAGVFGHFQG